MLPLTIKYMQYVQVIIYIYAICTSNLTKKYKISSATEETVTYLTPQLCLMGNTQLVKTKKNKYLSMSYLISIPLIT